tara:strand:+ start:676 stop:1029 length:354 start_codon:yes stop_codon:yes gene_type:complete
VENNTIADAELAELRRLWAAATLSELSSTHIINEGYTHLANLTTAPDKPCFVIMHRAEIIDWFAAIHNASMPLITRLEAAERERDRLKCRDEKLTCLEAGGVDNWDGYDFAMEDYNQ